MRKTGTICLATVLGLLFCDPLSFVCAQTVQLATNRNKESSANGNNLPGASAAYNRVTRGRNIDALGANQNDAERTRNGSPSLSNRTYPPGASAAYNRVIRGRNIDALGANQNDAERPGDGSLFSSNGNNPPGATATYNRATRGRNIDALGANQNDAERSPNVSRGQSVEQAVKPTLPEGSTQSMPDIAAQLSSRGRLHQLWLQYLQYDAFNKPEVYQRLKLTDAQRETFRQYDQEWNREIANLKAEYNPASTSWNKGFERLQKTAEENVTAALTPVQGKEWQKLVGEPFEFTPDFYLESTPVTATTAKPVLP